MNVFLLVSDEYVDYYEKELRMIETKMLEILGVGKLAVMIVDQDKSIGEAVDTIEKNLTLDDLILTVLPKPLDRELAGYINLRINAKNICNLINFDAPIFNFHMSMEKNIISAVAKNCFEGNLIFDTKIIKTLLDRQIEILLERDGKTLYFTDRKTNTRCCLLFYDNIDKIYDELQEDIIAKMQKGLHNIIVGTTSNYYNICNIIKTINDDEISLSDINIRLYPNIIVFLLRVYQILIKKGILKESKESLLSESKIVTVRNNVNRYARCKKMLMECGISISNVCFILNDSVSYEWRVSSIYDKDLILDYSCLECDSKFDHILRKKYFIVTNHDRTFIDLFNKGIEFSFNDIEEAFGEITFHNGGKIKLYPEQIEMLKNYFNDESTLLHSPRMCGKTAILKIISYIHRKNGNDFQIYSRKDFNINGIEFDIPEIFKGIKKKRLTIIDDFEFIDPKYFFEAISCFYNNELVLGGSVYNSNVSPYVLAIIDQIEKHSDMHDRVSLLRIYVNYDMLDDKRKNILQEFPIYMSDTVIKTEVTLER